MGVLLSFWCLFFCFCLMMGCGGVRRDVNVHVHVTLMMLRWSWGWVGWDGNVHVHVTLMMLRWSWGGVGWDANVHVHVTLKLFHGWNNFWEDLRSEKTGVQGCMCSYIGKCTQTPLKPPGAHASWSMYIQPMAKWGFINQQNWSA